MNNQFNNKHQEENAKAEQVGAAIAVGCIGIPALIFILILIVVIVVG